MREDWLARWVVSLKPSGIRKFFDIAATMDDVISLGIGEPDFDTPQHIVEAGCRSLQEGKTHYTSNHGLLELRQTLAAHMDKHYGLEFDPHTQAMITVGVSEALYLAFTAIINPGDEVIVPNPCFVSYQAEVQMAGGIPVPVPTFAEHNFDLEPDLIEKAITPKTKAIIFSNPCNPTGAVASYESLERVAQLAVKYNLVVVADEVYDRLVYGGHKHICFANFPRMKEHTVLLGGFSKAYAMTGWRIGFALAPAPILEMMVRIHQYSIMSAPTVSQVAAIEALRHGEEFVQEMREEYDRRRRLIVGGFNSLGLPTFEPKGAFYAFPDIRSTGLDDDTFCERLLYEAKVAMVPGSAFGPAGAGYVRASYATSYEKIEQALERIGGFLKNHHV
jgi:aminotransferase